MREVAAPLSLRQSFGLALNFDFSDSKMQTLFLKRDFHAAGMNSLAEDFVVDPSIGKIWIYGIGIRMDSLPKLNGKTISNFRIRYALTGLEDLSFSQQRPGAPSTGAPSVNPKRATSGVPTLRPTADPTLHPTLQPTTMSAPSLAPTLQPTTQPTRHPTLQPTTTPPTKVPTLLPSSTSAPLLMPTPTPTRAPTFAPDVKIPSRPRLLNSRDDAAVGMDFIEVFSGGISGTPCPNAAAGDEAECLKISRSPNTTDIRNAFDDIAEDGAAFAIFRFRKGTYIEYDGQQNLVVETSQDCTDTSGTGGVPFMLKPSNVGSAAADAYRTVAAYFSDDNGAFPFESCRPVLDWSYPGFTALKYVVNMRFLYTQSPIDCRGTLNGTARWDKCGECGGDDACIGCDGKQYASKDDAAKNDACGVCSGDDSTCLGCDGKFTDNYDMRWDMCHECNGRNTCVAKRVKTFAGVYPAYPIDEDDEEMHHEPTLYEPKTSGTTSITECGSTSDSVSSGAATSVITQSGEGEGTGESEGTGEGEGEGTGIDNYDYTACASSGLAGPARLNLPIDLSALNLSESHFSEGACGTNKTVKLHHPHGLMLTADGDVLFADMFNNMVRAVQVFGLEACAFAVRAGNGSAGYSDAVPDILSQWHSVSDGYQNLSTFSENVPGVLNRPVAVVADNYATTYIVDSGNHAIRTLVREEIAEDVYRMALRTLAGTVTNATRARAGYKDNIIPKAGRTASFSFPSAAAAIPDEGAILVADAGNAVVRKVTSDGLVTTLAGKGKAFANRSPPPIQVPALDARFRLLQAIEYDSSTRNWFVADMNCIRMYNASAGAIDLFAGSDCYAEQKKDGQGNGATYRDGALFKARFFQPMGLALRKSYFKQSSNMKVCLLADRLPCIHASTFLPMEGYDILYIADSGNHLIRPVSLCRVLSSVP